MQSKNRLIKIKRVHLDGGEIQRVIHHYLPLANSFYSTVNGKLTGGCIGKSAHQKYIQQLPILN